mmetsp:Transcript_56213/g.119669  ORF Transcript_56213/g.119669 Transcript_56213/m.119669 type:complete len:508 (-) Transcript_56213:79-1602(-)
MNEQMSVRLSAGRLKRPAKPRLMHFLSMASLVGSDEVGGCLLLRLESSLAVVSRSNWAVLDAAEANGGVRERRAQEGGLAGLAAGAGAARDAGGGGGDVRGVGGVQPKHVDLGVVPQRDHQDHAAIHRLAHLLEAALPREVVGVAEHVLLNTAEVIGDGILGVAQDRSHRVFDDLSVLQEDSLDLNQVAVVLAVVGDELGDDSDGLLGVDLELSALAVEVLLAHSVVVVVAAVFVADAVVALADQRVAACSSLTLDRTRVLTRVGRVGGRSAVCLPKVHLGAAAAVVADRRYGCVVPVPGIRGALDPLHVVGALGVAIAGSVLGARGVGRAHVALGVHLDKVEGAVQTACELTGIDGECELLVQELEHLVGVVVLHQVQPGAVVVRILSLGHELQVDRVPTGAHTIGGFIVGAFDAALAGAGLAIRAKALIPLVGVEVAVLAGDVGPSPVRVDGKTLFLVLASRIGIALLNGESGMHLGLHGSWLLRHNCRATDDSSEGDARTGSHG